MRKPLTVLVTVGILLFGWGVLSPCFASANILFILDSSGSMWGKVNNVAKITTAKKVLKGLLRDLPKDANVGLMAYGHRKKEDCNDVEVLTSIVANDPGRLTAGVQSLQPKGKTPLTYSLEKALPLFASLRGQKNYIVLISDGKETCGGEPCKAAGKMASAGVNLNIHVVGFGVSGEERKQLECIAGQGGGRYFNADSTAGFKEAIAAVKEEVKAVEPDPEPETAKLVEYFRDDFEGDDLSEHWEIINPDPDSFIVEKGELLMINSTPASFAADNIRNLFHLNKSLPEGDWIATAKIRIDFQSRNERIFFGLYDDKENYLVSVLSTGYDGNHHRHYLFISPTKALKGAVTANKTNVWGTERVADGSSRFFSPAMAKSQPILLRLEKKGREYTSSIKLTGVEKPEWKVLPGLKLLRAKGNIAIGVFQAAKSGGETTVKVDWIKIEALTKPE